MKKRTDALKMVLEKLGLSPERFRVEYVSAAEGVKFAALINEMTEQMKALGKEKIKAENEKLRPTLEKMLARKKK
jgi:F420-non-reducing hydrogenase iron-sulfur subunit